MRDASISLALDEADVALYESVPPISHEQSDHPERGFRSFATTSDDGKWEKEIEDAYNNRDSIFLVHSVEVLVMKFVRHCLEGSSERR